MISFKGLFLIFLGIVILWIAGCHQQELPVEPPAKKEGKYSNSDTCTFTLDFYRNHMEEWPAMHNGGDSMKIGCYWYHKDQLLQILNNTALDNGLIILAHQWIPARLNIFKGVWAPQEVLDAINGGHEIIGCRLIPPFGNNYRSPNEVKSAASILEDYNIGIIGPGYCK